MQLEEEEQDFRLPLVEENVAIGRLGRIYKALDRKTGRVLAVECIDIVDDVDESEEGNSYAESVREMLQTELARCKHALKGENGRHVFCFDSVNCSRRRVYLPSSSSVIRSLAALQQDFGRLHPLAVKQYIYQIVQGLRVLHEKGIWCGGLSLSSILLCGGDTVKIAAWFPFVQTLNALLEQQVLADPQFQRASFNTRSENEEMVQDVRSVAYIMVEMLTGLRVRGSLMEKCNLLAKVAIDSHEYQILRSLLDLTSLDEVLNHPYFSAVTSVDNSMSRSFIDVPQEQRHIIGVLTKQELTKCQSMKRQYLQQIRAWQAQFEKKYRRKPKPADRPAGIVRLQGRCQALNERMQEVNDRLAAAHGSIYRMISDKESLAMDSSSHSTPALEGSVDQQKSTADIDTSLVGVEESRSDSFRRGERKRSPAQKAFLNRFAK